MKFLTVASCLNCIHHDVLSCHERKLCHHVFLDYFRIYYQSVYYVQTEVKNTVNRKESFRNAETLVCRIIQGSLKPLCCGSDRRIQCVNHHVSGKRSNTLTSHRISLVCHCGRSDLRFLERFLNFFEVLEKADVIGHLVCTCCNTCKNIQDSCVDFAGVGLSGNRIALLESHLLCDHRIDLINCFLISIKKFQEACLCSGCSLGSKKLETSENIFQILKIHHEFLSPQSSTFTNSCRLCRLEMGKCQCRLILIFICEFGKLCDHIDQFLLNQLQSFCHYDDI